MPYDVIIVGGGIVGLASGLALLQGAPDARLLILEKEASLAPHQTGRNSGVIHSGIYYAPGSLKAKFAQEGNRLLQQFCRQHDIPHEMCGKVIVATEEAELPLLERLYQRALIHQLPVQRLSADGVRELEPYCRALAGLHLTTTGIVDYRVVASTIARLIQDRGGEIRLQTKVADLRATGDRIHVITPTDSLEGRFVVNCAGLHADRLARLMGLETGMEIVPIRGEYYMLRPERRHLVRGLIYPVPNPQYPFLGVHFTRMITGDVHAGPNAVLSFKREGYGRWAFDARDSLALARSSAFWRFAKANWREGLSEMRRSWSKTRFVKSLQRLVPDVTEHDLQTPHAGVRAQALGRDGRLIDDFVLVPGPRSLHVCNAPSPAATASLAIGRAVAEQVMSQAQLV